LPKNSTVHIVAALVLVVRAVQRLVHVADEVNQEHEVLAALVRREGGVVQRFPELLDLGDHAIALGTIARHVEVRLIDRNVDVMPRRGGGPRRTNLVGPTGNRNHGGVGSQNFVHPRARRRCKLGVGDPGHQAVPLGPPRKRRQAPRDNGNYDELPHER
jgi:hypothetical protein